MGWVRWVIKEENRGMRAMERAVILDGEQEGKIGLGRLKSRHKRDVT